MIDTLESVIQDMRNEAESMRRYGGYEGEELAEGIETYVERIELLGLSQSRYAKVREFHQAFGHPVITTPAVPDLVRTRLRLNLILEEVCELVEAHMVAPDSGSLALVEDMLRRSQMQIRIADAEEFSTDLVETADALGDIIYVANGMGLEYGIDLEAVGDEIHASNMTKLGADGKPVYDENGKVAKGPNYRKPDIAEVLRHG